MYQKATKVSKSNKCIKKYQKYQRVTQDLGEKRTYELSQRSNPHQVH